MLGTTVRNFRFVSFVAVQLPRLCYTTLFTISLCVEFAAGCYRSRYPRTTVHKKRMIKSA